MLSLTELKAFIILVITTFQKIMTLSKEARGSLRLEQVSGLLSTQNVLPAWGEWKGEKQRSKILVKM